MCDHGACRAVGQLLNPANPRVELVVESKRRRRRPGGGLGLSTNTVTSVLGDLRVSHCVPFIRADQGTLWGSSGLQNKGKQGRCTDVRFLGGSRREGEGFTRIPESNRRRHVRCVM